jgi:hypothetical protein
MTETGQPAGPEWHESGRSERWFSTGLDQSETLNYMEFVLGTMFGARHLDPPRLADPSGLFVGNRRRPDCGASLITGRSDLRGWAGEPAHIEVRLYPEHGGTTVYLGVAALCCRHPRRWEAQMLGAFERSWRAAGDDGLYRVRPPAYGT